MRKVFVVAAAVVFVCCTLFFACEQTLVPQGKNTFWAFDFRTNRPYRVFADKIFEGSKCEIWAENGSNIDISTAQAFAEEYDNVIYDLAVENFSITNFEYTPVSTQPPIHFDNIMDFASYMIGSEKLVILFINIREPVSAGDAVIGGYFDPTNLMAALPYSNREQMIYINAKFNMNNIDKLYAIIAHELQHLINFVTSRAVRSGSQADLWINEGLSTQAEQLYLGSHLRYEWFVDDPAGSIAKGNNFYVWDNHKEHHDSILDEYATVYLFFQWLYLQSNKDSDLFKKIGASKKTGYQAVTDAAAEIYSKWENWETLLGTWLAANYINAPSGEYGYKNEDTLKNIFVRTPMNGNTPINKLNLFPGEGVYSKIGAPFTPPGSSGQNIRYAGLQKASFGINNSGPYSGDALLTFNISTSIKGSAESGFLTGAALDVPKTPQDTMRAAGYRYLQFRDLHIPMENRIIEEIE